MEETEKKINSFTDDSVDAINNFFDTVLPEVETAKPEEETEKPHPQKSLEEVFMLCETMGYEAFRNQCEYYGYYTYYESYENMPGDNEHNYAVHASSEFEEDGIPGLHFFKTDYIRVNYKSDKKTITSAEYFVYDKENKRTNTKIAVKDDSRNDQYIAQYEDWSEYYGSLEDAWQGLKRHLSES